MKDIKQELMERLWDLTVHTLIDRIADGSASAQELNIARQMLKDHSVTVADVEESPLGDLSDLIPFPKHQTTEDDLIDAQPTSLFGSPENTLQ